MSEEKHVYCYSTDEEAFHNETGEEMTREDAIEEAICVLGLDPGDGFFLGIRVALRGEDFAPKACDIIETMGMRIDDRVGEISDGWPSTSLQQDEELTARIREVVGQWLDKHGLQPRFYAVDQVERLWVLDETHAEGAEGGAA